MTEPRILNVWTDLGGAAPIGNRAPAFWRGSKDRNIRINAEKNVFYDYARAVGGGVVALVSTALDCSTADALAHLNRTYAMPINSRPWIDQTELATAKTWLVAMLAWADTQLAECAAEPPSTDRVAKVRLLTLARLHLAEMQPDWRDRLPDAPALIHEYRKSLQEIPAIVREALAAME